MIPPRKILIFYDADVVFDQRMAYASNRLRFGFPAGQSSDGHLHAWSGKIRSQEQEAGT